MMRRRRASKEELCAEEIWPFTDGAPSTPMGERIAEWEQARTVA